MSEPAAKQGSRNPITFLPEAMQRSARGRFELVLVVLWIPLALGAVWFAGSLRSSDQGSQEAVSGSESGPQVLGVATVRGAETFSIDPPQDQRRFSEGERVLQLVQAEGGRLEARDHQAGQVVMASLRDEDGIRIFDSVGNLAFRLKEKDDEGYSIRGREGEVLCRAKVKSDKFNVYDAGGQRIRHGKHKRGGIEVKDAASEQVTLRIDGVSDLQQASVLALPIPSLVRALIHATP